MTQDGEVTGYLIGSYKYDLLNDVLSMLVLGESGSAFIVNKDGIIGAGRNHFFREIAFCQSLQASGSGGQGGGYFVCKHDYWRQKYFPYHKSGFCL